MHCLTVACLSVSVLCDDTSGVDVYQWDGVPSHDITKAPCRTAELDDKMQQRMHYPLRLVTTEITTQSMMVLPRDADLLYAVSAKAVS